MKEEAGERLLELMTQRATEGLGFSEVAELKGLSRGNPKVDPEAFELVAAALEVAWADNEARLPGRIKERITRQAAAVRFDREDSSRVLPFEPQRGKVRKRDSWQGWAGWAAAAAMIVVTGLAWWPLLQDSTGTLPSEQRVRLLSKDPNTLETPWKASEDVLARNASGDVVWSSAFQSGFLRIRGLAANDPSSFQYQLWVFDRVRDERYPVDGGVFDIPAGGGELVVPIRSSLEVSEAYLFAVTVERPGGVVVSARERIVLLAQTE